MNKAIMPHLAGLQRFSVLFEMTHYRETYAIT